MSIRYLNAGIVTLAAAATVTAFAYAWGHTFLFAFAINWILMGWAITLGRMLESPKGAFNGVSIQFPEGFFPTRPFERGGRIYDYLGVRWYRRLLRPVLWKLKPAQLRSGADARQAMLRATRDPEAGHFIMLIPIMVVTVWVLTRGWWTAAAWMLLFNLLHNAYPIMSMRQIRARLSAHAS